LICGGERERERHESILHEREEGRGQSPAAFTVGLWLLLLLRGVCGSIAASREQSREEDETRRDTTQRQTSGKQTTNSSRLRNSTNPCFPLSLLLLLLLLLLLSLRISKTMTTCST